MEERAAMQNSVSIDVQEAYFIPKDHFTPPYYWSVLNLGIKKKQKKTLIVLQSPQYFQSRDTLQHLAV